MSRLAVVTGAFGFTGSFIARRLLEEGWAVRTLTGHPQRPHPLQGQVEVAPLDFNDPEALASSLLGAETLYNTYWIRFPYRGVTYEQAVRNTEQLVHAAERAGVRRIVHLSVSNPSEDSPLPYFRGKAAAEAMVRAGGPSHAILRPTLIFGAGDILLNNIAWMLRRFPVFGMPGDGRYRVQPVAAEDVARLAVQAGQGEDDQTLEAAGPRIFTFEELVRLVARSVGRRARIMHMPPALALLGTRVVGLALHDVVLTRDEIAGLRANLLVSHDPPLGAKRLESWLEGRGDMLGRNYASELARRRA